MAAWRPCNACSFPAPGSMNQTRGVPCRFKSVMAASSSFLTKATSCEMFARSSASDAMAPPVIPSVSMCVTIRTNGAGRRRSAISWATASIAPSSGSPPHESLGGDGGETPTEFREERISRDVLSCRVIHVTATGLIAREGRVLLGKRTSTLRFAGMWDAFGGHLIPCGEPSSALVRGLAEELGITALRPRFLGIYEDIDTTSKELFRHYLFFVTRWSGDPKIANEEHSEVRWFTPGEAERLNLAPSLKDAIRRVLPKKP